MVKERLLYYAFKLLAKVGNAWSESPQNLPVAACLIQLDGMHSVRHMKHLPSKLLAEFVNDGKQPTSLKNAVRDSWSAVALPSSWTCCREERTIQRP